ncbi:MAG TPA: hypothetical protein VGI77_07480 [Gaiellaceae bacterium]
MLVPVRREQMIGGGVFVAWLLADLAVVRPSLRNSWCGRSAVCGHEQSKTRGPW